MFLWPVCLWVYGASQVTLVEKNPLAIAGASGDKGSIPGLGRSHEEGKATHSSAVAWRTPWTEEPGRLQSMGLQRVRHNQSNSACTNVCIYVLILFIKLIFLYLYNRKLYIYIYLSIFIHLFNWLYLCSSLVFKLYKFRENEELYHRD